MHKGMLVVLNDAGDSRFCRTNEMTINYMYYFLPANVAIIPPQITVKL